MYVPLRLLHASDLSRNCFIVRRISRKYGEYCRPAIRRKLHLSLRSRRAFVIFRGKSISERRNEFTVRGVPARTLSCRSCVSERYGDTTALIFYSALLYIAISTASYIVSETTPWKSRNCSLPLLPLLPRCARDGRFKIIKRHKFLLRRMLTRLTLRYIVR